MSPVPQAELVALKALSGYDQMLEMDRICRVYGTDEATVQAAMAALSTSSTPTPNPPANTWDTSHKEVPGLQSTSPPSAPKLVDKSQFRFEYDPTREASARRESVNQAILCSGCGVALGIPEVRPIQSDLPVMLV